MTQVSTTIHAFRTQSKVLTYIGEKKITEVPEFFNDLFEPADNENEYVDCDGNGVELTREEAESGIGTINLDGLYHTVYTCKEEDLNEVELTLVLKERETLYSVRDREAGNVITTFATIEDAKEFIRRCEHEHMAEWNYQEDFYEIYNNAKQEIVG